MNYTRVLYFLLFCIIILTVLVLYLFFPLIALSTPQKDSRPVPSITVINQSGEINKNSGTYIVTGTAQNTGTTTIVKVYLVATTYDANGTFLGSTYDALVNLKPGGLASFRIEVWPYYQGYLVSRYSLEPDYNNVPTLGGGNFYVPTPEGTLGSAQAKLRVNSSGYTPK
ncbi:MAG: FxLYD domain-containing protein [Methanomicrobiales archaeon]|nr:FxLYD domain-containing protein [Methanomicrobiales archaeon]